VELNSLPDAYRQHHNTINESLINHEHNHWYPANSSLQHYLMLPWALKSFFSFLENLASYVSGQKSSQDETYIESSNNEQTTNLELPEAFSDRLIAESVRHPTVTTNVDQLLRDTCLTASFPGQPG